jgi:hypothetical protein
MSNNFVKDRQDKYGNGKTSGRPKKKSSLLQAERRNNDIVSDEMILNDILYNFVFIANDQFR